ncbi:MAG: EthD family reductase [Chloroflexi bacterium]|nr:EthD family reductase [Chloroflexota bacterium]
MIRVAVLYPSTPGARFDHQYYAQKHIKLVRDRMGSLGLVSAETDKGLAGATPGAPLPFVAAGYLVFRSMDDFQKAFAAHTQEIMSDLPNYTDIAPVILVSEITSR